MWVGCAYNIDRLLKYYFYDKKDYKIINERTFHFLKSERMVGVYELWRVIV